MPLNIKYVHTNIVAKNWRKLADFYISVFGCKIIPPIRHYTGKELDSAVKINQATLTGVHLKLTRLQKIRSNIRNIFIQTLSKQAKQKSEHTRNHTSCI